MPEYPRLLERLVGTPLLALPSKAEVVAGVVLRRQGVEVNVAASAEVVQGGPKAGPLQRRQLQARGGFLYDPDTRIAVVEVLGSLAHRQGYVGASSGVMGYDGIDACFAEAVESPSVRAIVLDIDSPGGEVAGAFQLADRIAAARGRKPIIAVADEMAYSAAYLLAAACDEIWLASPVAGVGSIGAVVVHLSFQGALEAEGIRSTIFTFGKQKAEGNPFKDLAPDAAGRIQDRIDYVGREFVSRVARWRALSPKAVTDTEAGCFYGADAVKRRLANGVADPMAVFDALAQQIGTARRSVTYYS